MRRTTKPTTIKRLGMLLAAIMLTFTTAWAQYEDYTLTVIPNYDGAGSGVSIRVGYDWERGGHYVTLNTPYFEQQFNRGGGHHIVGYSYSSTDDAGIDIDATIELTENPTMLYAIWDDMIHWEVSKSSEEGKRYDILTFYGPYVMPDYPDTNKTPWAQYANDIKTLIINEGMKAIGSYAFGNFYRLTSVSLPNSLMSIGQDAFGGCSALTTIKIPANVFEIKSATFAYTGLTSIDIPASVTVIGGEIFSNCSNLSSVTVRATTPPELEQFAFTNNAAGRKIYVPYESLDAYKSADGWKDYANDILPISDIPGSGMTGIVSMEDVRSQMEDVYYTIDGRKVDSKPTQRGIYIKNGKIIVVK